MPCINNDSSIHILIKTKTLLFSIFLAFIFSAQVFAKKVEINEARKVAQNFYYERYTQYYGHISYSDILFSNVITEESNGEAVYYVFSTPTSFVIISAEDAMSPIIGYSFTNTFEKPAPKSNVGSYMHTYAEQAEWARDKKISADAETLAQWKYYLTDDINQLNLTKGDRNVDPLLLVMWNQDYPYNALCPEDESGPGGHVYAGCVATAMSMVMYYYRYPIHGTGTKTYYCAPYGSLTANFGNTYYKWDDMLNSITTGSGNSIAAIAELQYQCGVAVSMHYAPEASGAYSTDVPAAVRNYFGYSLQTQYAERASYNSTQWQSMILDNIDAKKPIYYSGQGTEGGHAFVLDGYQGTGINMLYHFNFGWSGQDNGFFSLNNLNGFNSNQAMVRNFIPKDNYPYGCGNDTLTNVNGSFEDGSGPLANYNAGNNCSWLIAPTDSVTSITLNFTAFDVASDDNVNVYDGATTSDPLLGTFTGSTIPTAVTSTGSKMLVTFTTNASNAAKGWQAEYTSTVKTYCSGITNITQPSGTISDGSGVKNYNNNSLCRWKIQPTGAPFVTLTFTNFQLVDPKDYIEIYDLGNNQLLATYTGTTIPPAVTSPSGKMYLVFRTGNFYNGDGWDATFSTTNSSHNISGVVNYPKSTPVPLSNIDLTLKDNNGTVVASTTTGADGSYNFASISDGDYTLTPLTTKAWGGVSATDVLLYKKHIAGISTLTGIFLNSGDVNGSGSLSASDILLIKKRIAGMISSFSVGDWLFDNTPITVSGNDVIQNFNGLVYGDANASYTPAVKDNYINNESSASFTIQPVTVQSGKIIVPVYASDVQNMGALQFTISYDPAKLQFAGADNWFNGIQDVTVGNPAPGQLTFVWAADADGINIANAKLFDLHFNSLSSETSTINWSDEPTTREYADWNGNISTPKYTDGTIENTLDNSSLTIYPNPNDGSFLLNFGSVKNPVTSVKIVNMLGGVVYEEQLTQNQSLSKTFNIHGLAKGIYTVLVKTENEQFMKKLIIE